jgi:hypothetical protein
MHIIAIFVCNSFILIYTFTDNTYMSIFILTCFDVYNLFRLQ